MLQQHFKHTAENKKLQANITSASASRVGHYGAIQMFYYYYYKLLVNSMTVQTSMTKFDAV